MNETLTLAVTGLSHDGRGIARPEEGPVLFVAGALPGQTVRALVLRRKARYGEAQLLEVLQPAPGQCAPGCPHHELCGGCPLQCLPYVEQLRWKERLALDALQRIGHLPEAAFAAVHPAPLLRAFRNKMEFAFGPASPSQNESGSTSSGALLLGLRGRGGREVTPVPGCQLMDESALALVQTVQDLAARSGLPAFVSRSTGPGSGEQDQDGWPLGAASASAPRAPASAPASGSPRDQRRGKGGARAENTRGRGFWRFLVLRCGQTESSPEPRYWATCLTSPGTPAQRTAVRSLGLELLMAFPSLAAFIHEERAEDDALALGQRRVLTLDAKGKERPEAALLYQDLDGCRLGLDAASFFQVNTAAAQILAARAKALLPPGGALLDLYCGAGAPGLVLAPNYQSVLGLESDARAVTLARNNAARLGLNHCRYLATDAADWLQNQNSGDTAKSNAPPGAKKQLAPFPAPKAGLHVGLDAALADPPRAGLSRAALDGLLAMAPRHLLYISCNPATLARDAALLAGLYSLERLEAVDLFPHSPHLECLSLWRRRD